MKKRNFDIFKIGPFVLSILSLLLSVFNFYNSNEQFKRINQPFLAETCDLAVMNRDDLQITKYSPDTTVDNIQLRLNLQNMGHEMLYYRVDSCMFQIENRIVKCTGDLNKNMLPLYPSESRQVFTDYVPYHLPWKFLTIQDENFKIYITYFNEDFSKKKVINRSMKVKFKKNGDIITRYLAVADKY